MKRYEHSSNFYKSKDPGKQAKLRKLEKRFEARAARVPLNTCLFDDPEIKRITKQVQRLWDK